MIFVEPNAQRVEPSNRIVFVPEQRYSHHSLNSVQRYLYEQNQRFDIMFGNFDFSKEAPTLSRSLHLDRLLLNQNGIAITSIPSPDCAEITSPKGFASPLMVF